MHCRHYKGTSGSGIKICERCGSILLRFPNRVVREIQYFVAPQCNAEEILQELREKQRKTTDFYEEYGKNRKELVEWVLEICESFKLKKLTAYLSVYLMDFSHSLSRIPKILFKSIGLTCILITSKNEESTKAPSLKDFQQYSNANFKELELEILRLTNWDLKVTTVLHFIEFYCSIGVVTDKEISDVRVIRHVREYSEILADLCIADSKFLNFSAEEIATACIAIARKISGISNIMNSHFCIVSKQDLNESALTEIYNCYLENFPE